MEQSTQLTVVLGPISSTNVRSSIEKILGTGYGIDTYPKISENHYFSPDALREVKYLGEHELYRVEFNDDTMGCVSAEQLGLGQRNQSVWFEYPRISDWGEALEFFTAEGDIIEVDAVAIKSLLDRDTRDSVKQQTAQTADRVGQQIKSARQSAGTTQQELSANTGIDQAIISKIENGKHIPRYDTLKRIADGLGITIHQLLGTEPVGQTP